MLRLSSRWSDVINKVLLSLLIVLSAALLAFIAYDTINNIPFTRDRTYLKFQYWVCMAFIAIYFVSAAISRRPIHYALTNIPFLLISLPYINIVSALDIELPVQVSYFLRYVPILRGAWAAILITRYVSHVRMISIFLSYLIVIIMAIGFASLIIFDFEGTINPSIDSYTTALWWSSMQTTTVGMPFDPVTSLGKVLAGILSAMGMMMFPMFTAYLTAIVRKRYAPKRPAANESSPGAKAGKAIVAAAKSAEKGA